MSSAPTRPTLRLDWCDQKAADYACKNWHYSQKIPAGKSVKVGVWENGSFRGAVIFSRGANNNIGSVFSLSQTEICELTRVALREHMTPVSRIVSIALRMVRGYCPGLRVIVSYADPAQGHHGGIYQAMGWAYAGNSRPQRELLVAGRFMHKRSASARWGTASPSQICRMTGRAVEYGPIEWKHTYYLALDAEMRDKITLLAKPYPKRIRERSADSGTAAYQTAGDGASPIRSLQLTDPHGPSD